MAYNVNIETPKGPAKVLKLSRNVEGQITDIKETVIDHGSHRDFDMPYEPFAEIRRPRSDIAYSGRRTILLENLMANPDMANILRSDIRMVAFSAFNAQSRSFAGFTDIVSSDKPEETYLRDAAIGVLRKVPSGEEAPRMRQSFEGSTNIINDLYRMIVPILGDWIRFDLIGKIRQVSAEMGLSGRLTEEAVVYDYLTTAGNYTRNSTTGDNDIGANTAATTFSADGMRTAMQTIATSKDRVSGAYLGYLANTLICGPRLVIPALQLLRSIDLQRTHGSTTEEVIGTGTVNPFSGMITNIVVSPWFGSSYQWALCYNSRGTFKFQEVEPFNVFQQTQDVNNSEAWLHLDVIEYLIRGYFGVGLVDDRAWYYSSSTTDATVS